MKAKWIGADGVAHTRPLQGRRPRLSGEGYRWKDKKEDINTCLTCTQPSCKYGVCKKYKNGGVEHAL